MKNLICISAPSGSGKTTLCKLVREVKPELIWSVSCTTRNPRKNESKLAVDFLGPDAKLANFEDLAQTLLVSNEFFFTD